MHLSRGKRETRAQHCSGITLCFAAARRVKSGREHNKFQLKYGRFATSGVRVYNIYAVVINGGQGMDPNVSRFRVNICIFQARAEKGFICFVLMKTDKIGHPAWAAKTFLYATTTTTFSVYFNILYTYIHFGVYMYTYSSNFKTDVFSVRIEDFRVFLFFSFLFFSIALLPLSRNYFRITSGCIAGGDRNRVYPDAAAVQ